MNLYPSILTGSIEEAQQQAVWISSYPKIRTVQVDIIDGLFADNLTITPIDMTAIDFGELSIDLHLLTEEPLDYVFEALPFKEQLTFRSMIAQVERMSSQSHFVDTVKKNEWQVGLSLDLYTPFEAIDEESWNEVDIIQLMAIEAGFQGKSFNESVLDKIAKLQEIRKQLDRDFEIIIDGGVKTKTIEKLQAAEVDSVVVGSDLWQSNSRTELDSVVNDFVDSE